VLWVLNLSYTWPVSQQITKRPHRWIHCHCTYHTISPCCTTHLCCEFIPLVRPGQSLNRSQNGRTGVSTATARTPPSAPAAPHICVVSSFPWLDLASLSSDHKTAAQVYPLPLHVPHHQPLLHHTFVLWVLTLGYQITKHQITKRPHRCIHCRCTYHTISPCCTTQLCCDFLPSVIRSQNIRSQNVRSHIRSQNIRSQNGHAGGSTATARTTPSAPAAPSTATHFSSTAQPAGPIASR